MRFKQVLLALFVMMLWLLPLRQAAAFTILPAAGTDDARWRELPVKFKVNYEFSPYPHEQLDQILLDAFAVWNGVPSSRLRFELDGPTNVRSEDFIGGRTTETAVVFDPNFKTNVGADSTVLAVGTAIHEGDRFVQGFVIINAFARGVGTDTERLRVILSHELGHSVGMGHTHDESSLMYPFAQMISQLSTDDVNGISYLYPRKEGIDSVPFGCGTINGAGPTLPPGQGMLLTGTWLAVFAAAWLGGRGRYSLITWLITRLIKAERA